MTANKAWIGIDVSKDTLDVCLLKQNNKPSFKKVGNTPSDFKKMLTWLQHAAPDTPFHFALEATGSYSNAVAEFLVEAECKVSVVNPALTHKAAELYDVGNRTDHTMALVIATYCRKEEPALWRRAQPEVRKLCALVRRRIALTEHLVQEKNRLAAPGLLQEIVRSLKKSISFLDKEIASIDKESEEHIDGTPSLKADHELLTSIGGIGARTAHVLLAELPAIDACAEASSYAAFAGLAPYEQSSGTSVRKPTRLSKQGSRLLRSHLYLPALSALQHNPLVKKFYDRLVARGKSRLCAVGAVMRKLLLLAYGVLKHREKFAVDWSVRPKQAAQA